MILLLISALFLICLSPRFPGFYYYYTFAKLNEECAPAYEYINSKCTDTPTMLNETLPFDPITVEYPQWLWGISPIANLGLLINSAANWLIYIYAGSRFRKIFKRKLSPIFIFLRKVFCVDRIRNINSSNNAGICKIYLIVTCRYRILLLFRCNVLFTILNSITIFIYRHASFKSKKL